MRGYIREVTKKQGSLSGSLYKDGANGISFGTMGLDLMQIEQKTCLCPPPCSIPDLNFLGMGAGLANFKRVFLRYIGVLAIESECGKGNDGTFSHTMA